jgi:regulatory protein
MDKAKLLSHLTKICSMREYCKKDIAAKIERLKGDDAIDTQAIISQLCEDKYIDENRYAAFFARDKSALAGWGVKKIRYALSAKGIPSETIDEALEQIDEGKARAKMNSVLSAKWRTLKGTEQEKFVKLVRFGQSRGYDYNQIKAFYDNVRRG